MTGTSSVGHQAKPAETSASSSPASSSTKASTSSSSDKSGGVPSDRQASSVNKVDVNSSKTSDAANRINSSQISDGKFKATNETSVGALAQKINDDGKGNVNSDSVKQSVKDIVNNNKDLKEAAKELDPNDPDYDQKLADLKIKEGEEVSVNGTQKQDNGIIDPADAIGANDRSGEFDQAGGASAPNGSQGSKNGQADLITQLVQGAIQAIASKDANAAGQLLSQIDSMLAELGNATGNPSENASKAANKITSGQTLNDSDKNEISEILSKGTPADKVAVLSALKSKLQNVANQSNSGKGSSTDPFSSMSNQAIYNLAGLNMNGGIGSTAAA